MTYFLISKVTLFLVFCSKVTLLFPVVTCFTSSILSEPYDYDDKLEFSYLTSSSQSDKLNSLSILHVKLLFLKSSVFILLNFGSLRVSRMLF